MSRSTSVLAACLNPPAITELDASEALPPWILLETRVYFAHRDNSSTANAKTSRGHQIEVSVSFAAPPALSYVCLHCPSLSSTNFVGEPRVLRYEKQFLLLHLPLTWSTSGVLTRSSEYYMYQVIQGKSKLSRIPDPDPSCLLLAEDLGIHSAGAGEYIVAGLCPALVAEGHELHLYSSESNAWTMKPALLENPKFEEHLPITPHKVIPLGGSLLGWVDLWKGILVCDVLSPHHHVFLRFIPLPGRLPGNTSAHLCPWKVRDVTCTNGSLKFIEIEHFPVHTAIEKSRPAFVPYTIYDDSPNVGPNDNFDPMKARSLFGWRSIIWNRVLSENCWRMGCNVLFDDILVENQSHSALLAGLGDDSSGNSKILNLLPSFPSLSIHGDDVVHMKALMRLDDVLKSHMISVDMRSNTLKTLVPCTAAKLDAYCPHFPCLLSNHLSNTPDLPEVVHASNSENVNAALSQIIQASHSQKITENERLRSCAQYVIGAPSQAQNGGSNTDFSLPPQQSFGSWDMMAGYNRSHRLGTHSIYGNNQWSWQFQQQPTYRPNCASRPSWFSPGSVNVHPAYPVSNTAAFGRMTHPPTSQAFAPPTPFSVPSILPPVTGHYLRSGHQRPHRHSPYEHPRQVVYPY